MPAAAPVPTRCSSGLGWSDRPGTYDAAHGSQGLGAVRGRVAAAEGGVGLRDPVPAVDVGDGTRAVKFRRGDRVVEVWGVANPTVPVEALAKVARLRLRQLGVERMRRAGPSLLD